MNLLIQKLTARRLLLSSIIVFLLSLLVGMGIVMHSELIAQKREKERASQVAASQTGKLRHVIENLLYTSRTVETLLTEGNGNIENFDQIMEDVLDNYPIKNISLAPDGIITQTYPYKGNEAAIGHNLLEDPKRAVESKEAMDSGKLTLSGPYDLRQGGFGAVGRLPIFLTNESGDTYFWGFVCVTLEFPKALKEAQMQSLVNQGYTYELWRIQPDTKQKQVFMKSDKKQNGVSVDESFALVNAVWTLSLAPEKGWMNIELFCFKIALAFFFSVLISLLYKNIVKLAVSHNDLDKSIRQQAANYEQLNQLNRELRDFRHDIKNHMLSLSILLRKEDISGASDYITSISETLASTARMINTENYVFDALLAEKTAAARKKNIQVESEIFIGKQLKIKNTDWSILFGNILDNAIESCEKLIDRPSKINIYVQYKKNVLHVRIENTAPEKPLNNEWHFKTTKNDPANHGIGLKQIQAIVRNYGGVLETNYDNGNFALSFMLIDV